MQQLFSLFAVALLLCVAGAHAQPGTAYCPLNPANGECGGVDAASGHGVAADSLFYCDLSAKNMELAQQTDGACRIFSELDSRYPVVVASTGEGKPIAFFATHAGTSHGRMSELLYSICSADDCSVASPPLSLAGFNGQFAVDFTHIEVDGKKLLVVVGVGEQTSADVGFGPDGFPVQYAYCVDEECSAFETTSLGDVLETAGDTKNVQRLVSLERVKTANGDRLAMLYFPGRGRAGFTHRFGSVDAPTSVPPATAMNDFTPSDGFVVSSAKRAVQFGAFNSEELPFRRRRDVRSDDEGEHKQAGTEEAWKSNNPEAAASLDNIAFYRGSMFAREYAVLAQCQDPPRCTDVSYTHVEASSSRVISPYRAARPWTRDSAYQPFSGGSILDLSEGMNDYANLPQNAWTSPHTRMWDEPFISKVHAAVPHLVATDQGLWVGFQVNHYQGLTDIDDGLARVHRMVSTNTDVRDFFTGYQHAVPALQYRALHMCLDVQMSTFQSLRTQQPVQGRPSSVQAVMAATDVPYFSDIDVPISTLLQRHEASPWPNTASLKWVSCGLEGEQCTLQSGYYTAERNILIKASSDGLGPSGPIWGLVNQEAGDNPMQHPSNTLGLRKKRGFVFGPSSSTSLFAMFAQSDGQLPQHGFASPPGVEIPDPNMGWGFQARRRTGAGASALQALPFDATELALATSVQPNVDTFHRYSGQLSESVAENAFGGPSSIILNLGQKRGFIVAETPVPGAVPFTGTLGFQSSLDGGMYADVSGRSCVDLLAHLSGADGEDGIEVHKHYASMNDPTGRVYSVVNPFLPSGYHGAQFLSPNINYAVRQSAPWVSGLHSGESAISVFATGAAGNGFPASVGVVSAEGGEPSAAGWSIVLSVCATPSCDQQIYRYLMDSSTLHDNWGMLDDPVTSNNEILNHPDGSWTIVIFVRPHGEGSVRERKQAADGRSGSTLYREGSSGKPLFINCLDETCSEASISTLAPNRLQSVLPADVVAEFNAPAGSSLVENNLQDPSVDFEFGGANNGVSIRMQAHQVHSYAYTGANHEKLLVAVRDISLCSGANMDPSSTRDSCQSRDQHVPAVRFWSTNRYASPTGEPCSRHSVGSVAVADDSVFVCTRLSTGHDLTLGGISGWVRYYEWVDVASSFASRLFANIPAGPSPLSTSLNAYPGDLWNNQDRFLVGDTLQSAP